MQKLLGIEMTDEDFDFLMEEQTKGKELFVENGKVVAKEHISAKEELEQREIANLTRWFDNYYAQHEQKYRRLMTLGKLDNDGLDPKEKIVALYEEAEAKRARIQELEKEMQDEEN